MIEAYLLKMKDKGFAQSLAFKNKNKFILVVGINVGIKQNILNLLLPSITKSHLLLQQGCSKCTQQAFSLFFCSWIRKDVPSCSL